MCSTIASNSGRRLSPASSDRSRPCGPRIGVQDREFELFLVRVEVDEQVVDLVQHLLRGALRRSIL